MLFSAIMLVTVTNKSLGIALKLLMSKKGLYRGNKMRYESQLMRKFLKSHSRIPPQKISAYAFATDHAVFLDGRKAFQNTFTLLFWPQVKLFQYRQIFY